MKNRHAFTLIEMLVVIAIIAIVASLVVGMNGLAQTRKRAAMVEADKQRLMLAIGNYQSKFNYYPPDNGNLATFGVVSNPASALLYDAYTQSNPLPYELAGAIVSNFPNFNEITSFPSNTVRSTFFNDVFDRTTVANSNPDEPHSFYIPSTKEYTNYQTRFVTPVYGLVVPVPYLPGTTNFWHYDSSSPNRHNLSSYDLWAEYVSGTKNGRPVIITNGNW